jgi:hypothetical protein
MDKWDERERAKKEPSNKFIFSIFGFGAGFIVGMLYTMIVVLGMK